MDIVDLKLHRHILVDLKRPRDHDAGSNSGDDNHRYSKEG